jgi:uncharacterized membrane protein YsdA (DUF1294 family)
LFAPLTILVGWIIATSLIAFASMGIDKASAKLHGRRIMKRTLWLEAMVGGFLGIMLGGLVFHHKTAKASFWLPVVMALILWAFLLYLSRAYV